MVKRKIAAALALALALLVVSGCASTRARAKETGPLSDSVSVVLLSPKELKAKFGWSLAANPFIAHAGTILPTPYDYVVAKLSIVTEAGAKVELLQAEVDNKDNKLKARLYDRKDFADYACSLALSQSDDIAAKRRNIVNWYYLPSMSLDLKHGKYEYILVFIGKHPLPDDVEAYVRLSVNDQEQEFSLDVPNVE